MKIGVDFDNTIAGYDRLFAELAHEAGLFTEPPATKTALRDALRRRGRQEELGYQRQLERSKRDSREGSGEIELRPRFPIST